MATDDRAADTKRFSRRVGLVTVLVCVVMLVVTAGQAAAASYTPVPLTGTSGEVPTTPFALNAAGDVVGGLSPGSFSSGSCVTDGHGFFWAPAAADPTTGTYTVLNGLSGATGDVCPVAVNDNGVVVGRSQTTAGGLTVQDGVVWNPLSAGGTVVQDLGHGVPPCTTSCSDFMSAQDVNNSGKIAGFGDTNAPSAFASVGFSAQFGSSTITNLGSSASLNTNEAAVNASGAVLLNPAPDGSGGSELLPPTGTQPGSDVAQGTANESFPLNDRGVVLAGGQEFQTRAPGMAASMIAVLRPLGAGGSPHGQALNNAGIAVGSSTAGAVSTAVMWPSASTGSQLSPVDLNTLIPAGAGYQLYNAVAINTNGWILAEAHPASAPMTTVLVLLESTASGTVTITSGNPVPEPASGATATAAFTITLPAASSSPTTVTYKTIDGTAKAANHDYTAVPNGADPGSVTIPAGGTTATVPVQVEPGSGNSTTETKSFNVQLTSSSGPPISLTGGIAPGIITVPGIGGTLTDDAGSPTVGDTVTLTGAASTGQAVSRTTTSGAGGKYQFYADPGTYTVTPTPPAGGRGNPFYDATACPGTVQPGKCANIALTPGAKLAADFKVISLVVNSNAITVNASQVTAGVCDVTPSTARATCTLPQAIEVSNQLGGRVIAFDIPGGGVPVITSVTGMPGIAAPATIDGTSQPGAHKVEIRDGAENGFDDPGSFTDCNNSGPVAGLRVRGSASRSTIRGMVIYGFRDQIDLQGGSDTIQGNFLGTDASGQVAKPNNACNPQSGVYIESGRNQIGGAGRATGNLISGNDTTSFIKGVLGAGIFEVANSGAGHNVIQGNTIGAPLGANTFLRPTVCSPATCDQFEALALRGGGDTVGGTAPGAGNLLVGEDAAVEGPGAVVQGNTDHVRLFAEGGVTVGGATSTPGIVPGNDFSAGESDGGSLAVGDNVVVQGNRFHGHGSAITLEGDRSTIGGYKPELGNLITNSASDAPNTSHQDAGIAVGENLPGDSEAARANDNTIENNQIESNIGDGGVAVYNGTGNTITANRMHANALGINLGGGPFFYNGSRRQSTGPNNNEPYPLLFSVVAHRQIDITGKLLAGHRGSYAIELYSQATCSRNSITPGQGGHYLGRQSAITTGAVGEAIFKLSFSRPPAGPGNDAVTATATAADGSTSEFSPCLTIGHTAPSFSKNGVSVQDRTITVKNGSQARSSLAFGLSAAKAKSKHHAPVPTASVHPFCPPITSGSCTGVITIRTRAHHAQPSIAVTRLKFKLAPGQLGPITFRVPKPVLRRLRRVHRLDASVTVTAHDRAKHRRQTVRRLVLR